MPVSAWVAGGACEAYLALLLQVKESAFRRVLPCALGKEDMQIERIS